MNQWLPLICLLVFAVLCGAVLFFLQRSFERSQARDAKLITDLCDRFFVSKNLPPTGVDMAERHQEQQKARENKRARVVPDRIGPVDRAQAQLLAQYEDQRLHIPGGGSQSGAVS